MSEDARGLEIDAYTAVVKAFAAGPPDWDKEEVLAKLRIILQIDNEFHMTLMTSIREGRPLPSRRAAARASASLGGAAGAAGRRRSSYSGDSLGLPDSDEDYSDELSRQRSRKAALLKGGGGGGGGRKDGKRSGGGGLGGASSLRRLPTAARPAGGGGGGPPRAAPGAPSTRPRSSRPRDGRYVTAFGEDPAGFVGRRVWRFWASEDPPWVEGYVSLWAPEAGWTIVYDPNTSVETMEECYNFDAAVEGVDYVMGEYVDVAAMAGSRRQAEKPVVSPAAYNAPPPYVAAPPSKKRKASVAPVPVDAPFEVGYFASRVPVASEEELQQMLAVLERKEKAVEAELRDLDNMEADGALLEERATLERKFAELCDKEDGIVAELQRLRATEA
eukprot:scaffold30.g4421.t1